MVSLALKVLSVTVFVCIMDIIFCFAERKLVELVLTTGNNTEENITVTNNTRKYINGTENYFYERGVVKPEVLFTKIPNDGKRNEVGKTTADVSTNVSLLKTTNNYFMETVYLNTVYEFEKERTLSTKNNDLFTEVSPLWTDSSHQSKSTNGQNRISQPLTYSNMLTSFKKVTNGDNHKSTVSSKLLPLTTSKMFTSFKKVTSAYTLTSDQKQIFQPSTDSKTLTNNRTPPPRIELPEATEQSQKNTPGNTSLLFKKVITDTTSASVSSLQNQLTALSDSTLSYPVIEHHFNDSSFVSTPSNESEDDHEAVVKFFKAAYPIELWKNYGFFTDDFLELIDVAWMRSPPPTATAHYIMAATYLIIMLIGTIGNGLVVYLFIRSRALRTPANILVLNLAISDFFLLLDMVLFVYNSVLQGPALGFIGCQLYGFIGGLTGTVSIVTLALIAYDRYNVIVFPMEPSRKTSHAGARAMVIFSWGYGITFSSLPLTKIGVSSYTPEGYLTSCSFDYMSRQSSNRIYIFSFFTAAWVLPLSLITFCYTRIYHMVKRTSDMATAVDSQRHCREEEKRKSEMKLAGIVAGVVVLWFVSWTPYAVVALLGVTGQHHLITPLSSMIPALFCKTASSIDPFVYAVTHPRFRKELIALWRGRRKRDRPHAKVKRKTPWTVEGATKGNDRDGGSLSSDHDVEEVFVMVDKGFSEDNGSTSSGSSTVSISRKNRSRKNRRRSQRISWTLDQPFPFSQDVINQLQPPSWFVPPRQFANRSVSLRMKDNIKPSTGPTSM